MRSVYILSLPLLLSPLFLKAQSLRFYREDIELSLHSDTFYVNGLYYYRNMDTTAVKTTLYYPYAENTSLGKVGWIRASNLSAGNDSDAIPHSGQKGAWIRLQVAPRDTTILKVQYAQKILGNQAEYIIVTTKKWDRPLDMANYVIKIPDDRYSLDSLSYQPDTCFHPKNERVCVFTKEHFMPDRNIIVYFTRKEDR